MRWRRPILRSKSSRTALARARPPGDRRCCVRIVAEPVGLAIESLLQGRPRHRRPPSCPRGKRMSASFSSPPGLGGSAIWDGHDIGHGRESHSAEVCPRLSGRGPVYPWPGHGPGDAARIRSRERGMPFAAGFVAPGSWPVPGSRATSATARQWRRTGGGTAKIVDMSALHSSGKGESIT